MIGGAGWLIAAKGSLFFITQEQKGLASQKYNYRDLMYQGQKVKVHVPNLSGSPNLGNILRCWVNKGQEWVEIFV